MGFDVFEVCFSDNGWCVEFEDGDLFLSLMINFGRLINVCVVKIVGIFLIVYSECVRVEFLVDVDGLFFFGFEVK